MYQLTIMLTTRLLQHKAMIVASDGCYEYHMNHQDVQDHDGNLAALEVDHILKCVCLFFERHLVMWGFSTVTKIHRTEVWNT